MTTLLLHGLGADRRQPLELLGPVLGAGEPGGEHVLAFDSRAHGESTLIGSAADFAIDRLADEIAGQPELADWAAAAGRAAAAGNAAIGSARPEATESERRPEVIESERPEATGSARPEAIESERRPEVIESAASPNLTPLTIIGISMGAAIALRIAVRGLLPVDRAVFIRPSFGDRPMPQNLRPFPVIGQLLHDRAGEPCARLVEDFSASGVYRDMEHRSPAGAKALLSQFTSPLAAERAIRLVEVPRNRAFANETELGGLSARGIRSLVVAAERDPVHPLELGERWAGALGAPLVTVPPREQGMSALTARLRDGVARWLAANPPA